MVHEDIGTVGEGDQFVVRGGVAGEHDRSGSRLEHTSSALLMTTFSLPIPAFRPLAVGVLRPVLGNYSGVAAVRDFLDRFRSVKVGRTSDPP